MKQILCFGDSNTWGYDGESRERLPWGVRWTSLLQEKLNKEKYRVIEEGLCGRTTVFEDPLRDGRKGTALLPTLLETHAQVDVITLMLGTNDCKTVFGASADVIGKGILRLLDQIQEYAPKAKVYHVGSGTSGSRYNQFKIRYSSRNNIYLIYKNMPLLQIILNLPFLAAGFLIKFLFFALKGMGKEYLAGIKNGFSISMNHRKVPFSVKHLPNYCKIQLELWENMFRRIRA